MCKVQSKTFGAPTVSGNIKPPLFLQKKNIVQNEIVGAGAASGLAIGTSADSATGVAGGGVLSGLGADIGKNVSSDFAKSVTEDTNTSPDRIKYFGDPTPMFDLNSSTVMPSFGCRFNNCAHSYKGLFIKDAVPLHDVQHNPLTPSPEHSKAEVITEQLDQNKIIIYSSLVIYKTTNYLCGYESIKTQT